MEDEKTTGSAGQHAPGCFICQDVMPALRNIWSDATRNHFRNSRIEFLKGVRSILDDRIARLARNEAKGTHVTVE